MDYTTKILAFSCGRILAIIMENLRSPVVETERREYDFRHMKKVRIYEYAKCSTCRNAMKFLDRNNVAYEKIPILETPPTRVDLKRMLAAQGGNVKKLFNTSGEVYREMKIGEKLKTITMDDALDLLDILISEIFAEATRVGEKARLRTIKDLDLAAAQLGQVCRLVLDTSIPDSALREAVFGKLPREDLEVALNQVERLVRPPEDMYFEELEKSYRRVRTFLRSLV